MENNREVKTPAELMELSIRKVNRGTGFSDSDLNSVKTDFEEALGSLIPNIPPHLLRKSVDRVQDRIYTFLRNRNLDFYSPFALFELRKEFVFETQKLQDFFTSREIFVKAIREVIEQSYASSLASSDMHEIRNPDMVKLAKNLVNDISKLRNSLEKLTVTEFAWNHGIFLERPILRKVMLDSQTENFSDWELLNYCYELAEKPVRQFTLVKEIMARDYAVNEIHLDNLALRLKSIRGSTALDYPEVLWSVKIEDSDRGARKIPPRKPDSFPTASDAQQIEDYYNEIPIRIEGIEEDFTLYGEVAFDQDDVLHVEWLTRKPGSNREDGNLELFEYFVDHIFDELNGLADEHGLTITSKLSNRICGITIDHGVWFLLRPGELGKVHNLGLRDNIEKFLDSNSECLVLDFDSRLDAYRSFVEKLLQLEGINLAGKLGIQHWRSGASITSTTGIAISRSGRIRITNCHECGQPLSDKTSAYFGYGPTCWKKLHPSERRNAEVRYQRLVRDQKVQRGARTAKLQIRDTLNGNHNWN